MLYHIDIYVPGNVINMLPHGTLKLKYGRHALQAANSDRYGQLTLPTVLQTWLAQVIEIETYDDTIVKAVYRLPLSNTLDLCLVVQPDGFVRTVWANEHNDNHCTLNKGKYAKPEIRT